MANNGGLTPEETPHEMMEISTAVHPEDILKTIDAAKTSIVDEPPPGFFAKLTTPGAVERAREIEQVKTLQIKARRVYIERLTTMIDTYVSVHEADLKIRKRAFILATFANLRDAIQKAIESSFASFWETFSVNYSRIDAIPNLKPAQKAEQLEALYKRTAQALTETLKAYNDLLDEFRKEVVSVVKEVERG